MYDKLYNDNVSFSRNYNVNDNVKTNVNLKRSPNQVDAIADRIMMKLRADDSSRGFYCKVAWRLSEAIINKNLEIALRSDRSPQRYFTWLCKRDMGI